MKKAILAVAALIVSCAAHAEEFDSADLMKSCNSAVSFFNTGIKSEAEKALVCVAYIRGVVESYNAVFEVTPTMDRLYCIPSTLTFRDVAVVTSGYLKKNSRSVRQYTAASLVLAGLVDAYPCR
jgi:hypothetical protein